MPSIAYSNLFRTATVTATDEATGYEKENAYNGNLFDGWKPASAGTKYLKATFAAPVDADYFSVFGQDLFDQSDSVQLQYSTDDIAWSNATSVITPTVGSVVYEEFTSVNARYWRVELITTKPAFLGFVAFGERLELPKKMMTGFAPPTFVRKNKYTNKSTIKGVPLPRTVERMASQLKIDQKYLDEAWARTNWFDFLDHAETLPFIFSWDYDNYPDEACYCRTSRDPTMKYSTYNKMDASISVDMLTELDI